MERWQKVKSSPRIALDEDAQLPSVPDSDADCEEAERLVAYDSRLFEYSSETKEV